MNVRKESLSCTRNGMEVYYVHITVDTVADVPNPADHPEWEVGSTLYITSTHEFKVLNNAGGFE